MIIIGNDLRLVLTLDELATAAAALLSLGLGDAQVLITHRDGSPWIELDAVRVPATEQGWPPTWGAAPVRLAMWRYTLDVFAVDVDGAVGDDPIYQPKEP